MADQIYEIHNRDSLIQKIKILESEEEEAKINLLDSIKNALSERNELNKMMNNLKIDELISKSENIIMDYNIECFKDLNIIDDIKKLNYAEENVKSVIKVVDDLVDLRLCAKSVEDAIVSEDFEQASGYIHRYSKIDKHFLQEYLSPETRQAEINSSFELLNEMKHKLQNILLQKFEESIKTMDLRSIERYFKLLPLVGHHSAGLKLFIMFSIKAVLHEYEISKELLKNTEKELLPVILIGKLLQILAGHILKYQPMVDTYYGPGEVIYVAREIQSEAVVSVKSLLNDFRVYNKIGEKLECCKNNIEDPSDILTNLQKKLVWNYDALLQSCSSLLINFETYHRYLRKILTMDVNILANDLNVERKDSLLNEVSYHSSFMDIRDEIINIYIQLERFFLLITCFKAFQINTINDDTFSSTAVDDNFYVFKKCIKRSLNTLTSNAVDSIIGSIDQFLITEYMNFITKNIYETLKQDMIKNLAEVNGYIYRKEAKSLKLVLVSLNNLQISIENYEKMIAYIKTEFQSIPNISKAILEKNSRSFEKFTLRCKSYKNDGYINLMESGLKKVIENILNNFHAENHIILDDNNENSFNSCLNKLSSFFRFFFLEIRKILIKTNYEEFMLIIIKETSNIIEARIQHCLFNQQGGFLLEKQISDLIKVFSDASQTSVRLRFNRIGKICNLLSSSDITPKELHESLVHNYEKVITYKEVVSFLVQRVDLDKEFIRSLKEYI